MEWPLGGKAEQEVKCDSAFPKCFHLSGSCGKLSGLQRHTAFCFKATFLFVFPSAYNRNATCGASRNCLIPATQDVPNQSALLSPCEVSWGNGDAPSRVSSRLKDNATLKSCREKLKGFGGVL